MGEYFLPKIKIFEVWIPMISSFDQLSTTRPITVSCSSIFFMLDLDERSFHIFLISNLFINYHLIQGWLLFIKGVTYVKSSYFHSLSVFNSESLCAWENQSRNKENIIISFIDVLSKGFISNPVKVVIFDFYPGGMYHRGDFLFDRSFMSL